MTLRNRVRRWLGIEEDKLTFQARVDKIDYWLDPIRPGGTDYVPAYVVRDLREQMMELRRVLNLQVEHEWIPDPSYLPEPHRTIKVLRLTPIPPKGRKAKTKK